MEKKELRKQYKTLRKEMTIDEREERSYDIFKQTIQSFDLEGKKVSVFLPIERFLEINTWHFLTELKADFYLPVIKGSNKLVHIKYENKAQLETTNWGIPEPKYGDTIHEIELDYVLVPLLAIDLNGYRVGYGKGFYDQFLSKCSPNCCFIGLNYYKPIEMITDLHENDIPLNYCVSPKGVIKF